MARTGPSQVVSTPMAAAPLNGLIKSSIKPPPDELAEGHWRNGIMYEPEGCQYGQTLETCEPASTVYPPHPAIAEWVPYGIQVTERCSTFSYREERIARVERLMNMDTERQLGREFWSGEVAQSASWPNTWLNNVADVVELTSGAITPEDALGCLENYLQSHNGGQQGMIHATAHTAVHWFKSYLVMKDPADGLLKTPLGTIVVVSPSYPGTDPSGVTGNGNVWSYCTDLVRVWLSKPESYDLEHTIDRANNTVQTQSDRHGLAEFQKCRHAGVQININPCTGESS
jgi:hypothetical protein